MSFLDVNECTVSNGGCSHKCVNAAGGYKCECPDPELSLALDNKTCHGKCGLNIAIPLKPSYIFVCTIYTFSDRSVNAQFDVILHVNALPLVSSTIVNISYLVHNNFLYIISASGVSVQCNRDNIKIIIPKSLLRGIDGEHLRLLDTTCKAKETSADFSLTTPLTGCNTTRRQTPTAIAYSNTVLEIPVAAENVVTRVREIEIEFSCFYSKYGVVSSVGWKPSNRKLVFSDEGKGNFTLSLNMFPDKRFVSPYTKDDFPLAVLLRKLLFFEASVTSGDKQRIFAMPRLRSNSRIP